MLIRVHSLMEEVHEFTVLAIENKNCYKQVLLSNRTIYMYMYIQSVIFWY